MRLTLLADRTCIVKPDYSYYLIGFNPDMVRTGHMASVMAQLTGPCGVEAEPYNPLRPADALPTWRGTATQSTPMTPAPVQPMPVSSGMAQPADPYPGAKVQPYRDKVTGAVIGYRVAFDREIPGTSWLYNDHQDMPRVWKARIGGMWTPIDKRPAMLAELAKRNAPVAAPLPYGTAPTAPAKARKRR